MCPAPAPVLTGCRVLVTAQRRGAELRAALEERGAEVELVPLLGFVPEDQQQLVRRTRTLVARPPDVLVVTTGTAFERWLDVAGRAGLAEGLVRALGGARLAARGPGASRSLRAAGLVADRVAECETSQELVDFLVGEGVRGLRVAVLHGGAGTTGSDDALERAGASVVPLDVYRWGPPADRASVDRAAAGCGAGRFDGVVLTSAPGAAAWLEALDRAGATDQVRDRVSDGRLLLAAVGPVTAAPLAFAGMLAQLPCRPWWGALARLVITELGGDRQAIRTVHGRLRIRAGAVTLDHRPIAVSPSGTAVLRRLAATPGHVVTREELLEALPGVSSDPHAAEVAVARLRESLREAVGDSRLVRTVVKRGYVLAAG
ncbi:uroporphyrinogen-III synthase [Nocardioides caldifontis]|uniref:uroporphyrinogen-III synthase n=1 Tax=Nocardioides caldifontis TaxID=2588938 RepID=UPI0011DF7E5B|nr:uroporphyrinogen-III synthase [Nocardioides caldifontis]